MNYTAIQAIQQLNKLLQLDRTLTEKLVNTRYPVSKEYVQADEFVYMHENDQDTPNAGLVGVLNGLLQLGEENRIAANYDEHDMKLIDFSLVNVTKK